MIRDEKDQTAIPGNRSTRLEMLVSLLDKEGVSARVTGPSLTKLVVPADMTENDGIRLSPREHQSLDHTAAYRAETQTEALLVGIGLLAGFSLAQLLFHWL